MNMSITHPYTWRWFMSNENERREAASWDAEQILKRGKAYSHTRLRGEIPGCIPEASPLSKDQKFMDKYHIGPHDPQWLFEMVREREQEG